jgi:hypothetical protein
MDTVYVCKSINNKRKGFDGIKLLIAGHDYSGIIDVEKGVARLLATVVGG